MAIFEYTSRAYQHEISHDDCMQLAEDVVEALEHSPVLTNAMLAITRHESIHIMDIQASVDCLPGDKVSCAMALLAADEQFIDALRACSGEYVVCRSMLRPFRPRV